MSAVAAPDARHHHDDQHGVELEDEQSPRVPESAAEALPEAEKFGNIICAGIWTQSRGGGGWRGRPTNPGLPPSSAPGAHEELLRVQGQRAIGLIEASEVWERLRRRDTSKATLSFGSRSTGQQIRVLDAANEEFG